jgi:mannose-6-phosphate isomerase
VASHRASDTDRETGDTDRESRDVNSQTSPPVAPIRLPTNYVARFYRAGTHLGAFRGQPTGEYEPEDWVGSVTLVNGAVDGLGRSRLADGRWLADAVGGAPEAYLGAAHVDRFGAGTELLVKLLDAGERLPVHCHPSREFAREHLACRHGKTEAWVILSAPPDGAVYLGFRDAVPSATLSGWVERQDSAGMLAAMNRIPVRAGDALLVAAGIPHAIGAGIFLTELQEPTDLSVLLEWQGYDTDGPREGHLGLGYDTALASVDTSAWAPARIGELRLAEPEPLADGIRRLLPRLADPFFRAERVSDGATLDAAFSILVVTEGELHLVTGSGHRTTARAGETLLLAHAAGECLITGAGSAIRCRPPDPAIGPRQP